jgi:hypothetical protein
MKLREIKFSKIQAPNRSLNLLLITYYLLLELTAVYAQSKNDYISKYSIALKEASETQYWIQIMIKSELVSEEKFSLMKPEIVEIIKILTATINKLKSS